jgi:DNA-binding transcriptional regulator YiaG
MSIGTLYKNPNGEILPIHRVRAHDLRHWLKNSPLTAAKLATALKVSTATVYNWTSGKVATPMWLLPALAQHFNSVPLHTSPDEPPQGETCELEVWLLAHKMTRTDLANFLDVDYSSLNRWVQPERHPSWLPRVLRFFGPPMLLQVGQPVYVADKQGRVHEVSESLNGAEIYEMIPVNAATLWPDEK